MDLAEFKAFAQTNLEIAKTLLQRDGAVRPMTFVFDAEWNLSLCDMSYVPEEVGMATAVHMVVQKYKGVAFLHVGEMWISHVSKEELATGQHPMPRDAPDRREGIMVFGKHVDGTFAYVVEFAREHERFTFSKVRDEHKGMGGLYRAIPLWRTS